MNAKERRTDWTEFGKKSGIKTQTMMRMETMRSEFEALDSLDVRPNTHTFARSSNVFVHGIYANFTLPGRSRSVCVGEPATYFVYLIFVAFDSRTCSGNTTAASFQPLLSIRLTLPFPQRNNIHSIICLRAVVSVCVWSMEHRLELVTETEQTKEPLFTFQCSAFGLHHRHSHNIILLNKSVQEAN